MATIHLTAENFTPRVQRWLQKPQTAKLLHLFDQVINLIDADGEIVSVMQPNLRPGPFSLLIGEARPFPSLVAPFAPVAKTQAGLIIGPLAIDCRAAELWQPSPTWPRLREKQAAWLGTLGEMQTAVNNHLNDLNVSSPANFTARFEGIIAELLAVEVAADPVAWQTAVTQLAGLGPGFTPAGDDFLVGFLYGLWATRSAADVVELAKVVVETAVPRTTQLSAAWLQAAGRGEAVEPWHDLVNALLTHADWQFPLQKILQTGATSGAAALLGFITAAQNSQFR
jgi:hypothetical protein